MKNWYDGNMAASSTSTFGADGPSGKPVLRKGITSAAVREWQSIVGATPVDGNFGNGTEAKTKAWQSAHGLSADGVVGPQSWAMALGDKVPSPVAAKPAAAAPIASAPSAGTVVQHSTLRKGSTGPEVKEWQKVLGIDQDGQFGPNTEAKTKAFQNAAGLTSDGVVGPQTWLAAHVSHATIAASVPSITTSSGGVTVAVRPSVQQIAATIPLKVVDPSGQFPTAERPPLSEISAAVQKPIAQIKAIIANGTKPSITPDNSVQIAANGQQIVKDDPWYKKPIVWLGAAAATIGGIFFFTKD